MTDKIIVKQADLLRALNKALPGIEKGNALIEGADTFVFNGEGTLRTYNDAISVSVTDTKLMGLRGAVKASDFHKIVKKLTAEEIEVECGDDAWRLKCGRAKPTITRFQDNITQFLECIDSDVSEWVALPADFMDAIRLCFIAGNKAAKRGIYGESGVLYSTDGRIVNRYTFEESFPDFYLDDPAIAELLKLGKFTEINVGLGWVHFRGDNDVVFSAKLKDRMDYPISGIEQYFQTADEAVAVVKTSLPEGVAEVADRVAVFGADTGDQGATAIEITLRPDALVLSSRRVSGGNEEEVPWKEPITIEAPISALVDPFFLIEAASKAPTLSVIDSGDSPLLAFSSLRFTQIGSTRAKA